jgi:hypothetical protein
MEQKFKFGSRYLTKEEAWLELRTAFRAAKAKREAEEAKRKAREEALTEKVVIQFDWELIRRQRIIDQQWQAMLDQKAEREAYASCHRGPGDPDWSA